MKQYLLFFFTGFIALFGVILDFQLNIAGILSILTLVGAIGLFVVAAIISLFSQKIGAGIGSVCLLLILPWTGILPFGVISDTHSFQIAILLTFIPVLLVLFSGIYAVKKSILNNDLDWHWDNKIKPVYKYSALTIHLIIIILWAYSLLSFQSNLV